MMSAPAAMASSASASDCTSTSMRSAKPPTDRARSTAVVIDPCTSLQCESRWCIKSHTCRPDVVVLEHDHAGQIMAVGVGTTDEHTVLLDEAEACCRRNRMSNSGSDKVRLTWCCLARASEDALVAGGGGDILEALRPATARTMHGRQNKMTGVRTSWQYHYSELGDSGRRVRQAGSCAPCRGRWRPLSQG